MRLSSLVPWSKNRGDIMRRGLSGRFEEMFDLMRRDMERFYDVDPLGVWGSSSVNVDVKESDNEVVVTAELPGVDEKDISLNLANGILSIQGEKKEEREEKEENYYLSERSYGAFNRSLRLPYEADPEKVNAEFKNGVLKVRIPKPKEEGRKTKKIKIKS